LHLGVPQIKQRVGHVTGGRGILHIGQLGFICFHSSIHDRQNRWSHRSLLKMDDLDW